MTGVRAGRIQQVSDKPIHTVNYKLTEITAHQFLMDITDVVDSNPTAARYSITYVDKFKMQRVMIMEVNPIATRAIPQKH